MSIPSRRLPDFGAVRRKAVTLSAPSLVTERLLSPA